MLKTTFASHRRLAWVAGLAAGLWAASGILHPLLHFTTPQPVTFMPPSVAIDSTGVQPLAALLPDTALHSARLLLLEGAPAWRVHPVGGTPFLLDARDGQRVDDGEERHAAFVAAHYSGRDAGRVERATLVTTFSLAYPEINRFLPAWEVRFSGDDGFTAYVDTERDALARLTHDSRQFWLAVFQQVHTLAFLDSVEPLRLGVITMLILSVLVMAILGFILLLRLKSRGGWWRRSHRVLGMIILVPLLAYTGSGLLHLWRYSPLFQDNTVVPRPTFDSHALVGLPLSEAPLRDVRVVRVDDALYWRGVTTEPKPHTLYWQMDGTPAPMPDPVMAQRIAKASADASVAPLFTFTPEYGFANRILPVWRVEDAHGRRFVDTLSGTVVHESTPIKRLELWSFNHLHKWQFMRAVMSVSQRDRLQIALTSFIIVMACLGLWMRWQRRS